MLGLLYQDLVVLRKAFLSIAMIILLLSFLSAFQGAGMLLLRLLSFTFAAMVPSSLVDLEERVRWTAYAAAMPPTRGEMVTEKYLLGLLLSLTVGAVTLLWLLLRDAVGEAGYAAAQLPTIAAGVGLGLLLISVQLPLTYWLGSQKAVIATPIVTGLFTGGVCFVGMSDGLDLSVLSKIPGFVLPLAIAALLVLSWRLSVWAFRRRDL